MPRSLPLLLQFSLIFLLGSAQADQTSLYYRIGGQPVLTAVASELIELASQAPATKRSFNKVNLDRVKEKLAEQLCVLTGGPCTYTGDDMRLVHRGLEINEREFYAMVEQLQDLLDQRGIASCEKNELLALLAPLKPQIVSPVAPGP